MNFKGSTLGVITIVLMLPFWSSGQDLRKQIMGAQRRVMKEVKRTNRDAKKVKKMFGSSKKTVDSSSDTADIITWSKAPYIPNSGMIHDYDYIYTFFHAQQEYSFKNDRSLKDIEWDSVENVFYNNIGAHDSIDTKYEVIGWHPYWMEDAYKYYNYDLLTMLSLYSYDIDPLTGKNRNPSMVKQAVEDSVAKFIKQQNPNVKVLLSITSFGSENNEMFLASREVQNQFIEELLSIMIDGNFDGVDVNFEQIPVLYGDFFNFFIKKLSTQLQNGGYSLILDVPYFNDENTFNYAELKYFVTYFNIMGYDFSGEHSDFPGSVAPLNALTNQPSLETCVNDFLNLGIDGGHIILSLPLYGVTWDIKDIKIGQSAYLESLPYYEIISTYDTEYNPNFDPISASFFYLMNDAESSKICWFENETSLDIKYDWIKSKNLRGVGLWAMGYSQGSIDIWQGISKSFGVDSLVKTEPIKSSLSGPYGLALSIHNNKKIIGLGFLIFVGFLVVGFVYALTDWRVRDALFVNQSFRVIYSMIFMILSIFGLQYFLILTPQWAIVLGVLVGSLGVVLINMFFSHNRRKLR